MATTLRERSSWLTARGELSLDVPRIMGIVNVTPDSFWSDGRSTDPSAALQHAELLLEQGADILDVGGAKAALHRRHAARGRLGPAHEIRLERHHTRVGKQQRRIVHRDQRRARPAGVLSLLEEVQERLADLVGFHGRLGG